MPAWLTQPFATLIAASLALAISLITTFITLWNSRRQDSRGAFRELLTSNVAELSEALHEVVAAADVLLKTRSDVSHKAWCLKGKAAKNKLIACRSRLRYPLWGITDTLTTLSRVPSWAAHAKRYPESAKRLVAAGDELRKRIDDAVFYSVMKGRRPKRRLRAKVLKAEKELLGIYKAFREADHQAEQ
jgi:hypothetical protein